MFWKCTICGYVNNGDKAPEKCPKCGTSEKSFSLMPEADAKKASESDRTNDIHMEIIGLAAKIKELAAEGMNINLDQSCAELFAHARQEACIIKQRSKAELAGHVTRGKW